MGLLQYAAKIVFGLDILFFLLLGFSYLFADPGTGSYVMIQLTLIPTVLTFVASVAVIYTGWEPF